MFPDQSAPDMLVGLGAADDAAVWRLDNERALVVTLDFFTPIVDDPYAYGAIAAANALSDLYAMGARPLFALNIAAMPARLPASVMAEIMRGGAEKVREAGAVIAGGHSVQDEEPKYGLVAIGLARQSELITKSGAMPGDILLLSKPLGTGVTTTALKNGAAREEDVVQVIDWMSRLNEAAGRLATRTGVRAGTDVTGFGLLGHAAELAKASSVRIEIFLESIPFFQGAIGYAHQGHFPGGSADNRLFFGEVAQFEAEIDEFTQMLLFDAQTSGGLMLAASPDKAKQLISEAKASSIPIWPIGHVVAGEGIDVRKSAFPTDLQPALVVDRLWFFPSERSLG